MLLEGVGSGTPQRSRCSRGLLTALLWCAGCAQLDRWTELGARPQPPATSAERTETVAPWPWPPAVAPSLPSMSQAEKYDLLCEHFYQAILGPAQADGGGDSLRSLVLGGRDVRVGSGFAIIPVGPLVENDHSWVTLGSDVYSQVPRRLLRPLVAEMEQIGVGMIQATIQHQYDQVMCAYHGCYINDYVGCTLRSAPAQLDEAWRQDGWEQIPEVRVPLPKSVPGSCVQGFCEWSCIQGTCGWDLDKPKGLVISEPPP
jgi:hypothetical protein